MYPFTTPGYPTTFGITGSPIGFGGTCGIPGFTGTTGFPGVVSPITSQYGLQSPVGIPSFQGVTGFPGFTGQIGWPTAPFWTQPQSWTQIPGWTQGSTWTNPIGSSAPFVSAPWGTTPWGTTPWSTTPWSGSIPTTFGFGGQQTCGQVIPTVTSNGCVTGGITGMPYTGCFTGTGTIGHGFGYGSQFLGQSGFGSQPFGYTLPWTSPIAGQPFGFSPAFTGIPYGQGSIAPVTSPTMFPGAFATSPFIGSPVAASPFAGFTHGQTYGTSPFSMGAVSTPVSPFSGQTGYTTPVIPSPAPVGGWYSQPYPFASHVPVVVGGPIGQGTIGAQASPTIGLHREAA